MTTTVRPLISVVIPNLNSVEFLPLALRSTLSQRVELEIVIQDGGSNDGTYDVVSAISDDGAGRLR